MADRDARKKGIGGEVVALIWYSLRRVEGKEITVSRIGNKPVQIPAGVEVAVDGTHVSVKGPKGTLEADFYEKLTIEVADGVLTVSRPDDERETRARHGLTRALIQNMVTGVSEATPRSSSSLALATVSSSRVRIWICPWVTPTR